MELGNSEADYVSRLAEVLSEALDREFPFAGQSSAITTARYKAFQQTGDWDKAISSPQVVAEAEKYFKAYHATLANDELRKSWISRLESAGVTTNRKVKPVVQRMLVDVTNTDLDAFDEFIRRVHWTVYEEIERELHRLQPPQRFKRFHEELVHNIRAYVLICGSRGEHHEAHLPFLRDHQAWPRFAEMSSVIADLLSSDLAAFVLLQERLAGFPVLADSFSLWAETVKEIEEAQNRLRTAAKEAESSNTSPRKRNYGRRS